MSTAGSATAWVVVAVVVAFMLVGGLVLVLGIRRYFRKGRARLAEISEFAQARGFAYQLYEPSLPDQLAPEPFRRGHLRQANHVVRGSVAGQAVLAFDHGFRTSSLGGEDRPWSFGVVAVALPVAVPRLALIGGAVPRLPPKGVDEHPTGDAAFDDFYRTFGDDRAFAAALLTPAMRRWLLAQAPPSVWLEGRDAVVFAAQPLIPVELDRWSGFLARFLREVPAAAWERAAGGPVT